MKKIIVFLLALVMVFSVFACTKKGSNKPADTTSGTTTDPVIDGTTQTTAPVTTENPEGVESANYLDDDLNPTLVKIRPQDTPLDTITRMIGNVEKSEAWEAGGWEIGTRAITDTVTISKSNGTMTATGDMWLVGDTFILVDKENGPVMDGASVPQPISFLITAKTGNTLNIQRVGASTHVAIPAEADGSHNVLRLSRAVSELTASVTGFAIQPTDRKYYNQTHMCQVEESVIHSIHKKKVSMDFTTYKEQTL
jgi:predicted small lipoprotein YifL